jgi:hypothetical protein
MMDGNSTGGEEVCVIYSTDQAIDDGNDDRDRLARKTRPSSIENRLPLQAMFARGVGRSRLDPDMHQVRLEWKYLIVSTMSN